MKGPAMLLIILLFWMAIMALLFKQPLINFFFRPNVILEEYKIEKITTPAGNTETILTGMIYNDSQYTANRVRLTFKLYNADGIVIDSKWVSVENLLPGERWKIREVWIPAEVTEARLVELKLVNY